MSGLAPLRSALRATAPAAARSHISHPLLNQTSARAFQTSAVRNAYKDDQDRESLKPKAHEYTQSGTDDQAAANSDAAFNPNKTSPEAEKEAAGQSPAGGDNNPLTNSPADKSVNAGGQGHAEDKTHGGNKKSSGHGSPQKGNKV